MDITFYGVRGSCPCPSEATRRYGGNTACVALRVGGEAPLLLDLGTGLRAFGETQPTDGTFRAAALVTHIHWDHVQGLPFFAPVDRAGACLDVWGPPQEGQSLADAIGGLVTPPYFPVRVGDLRGEVHFHEVGGAEMAIGGAKVSARAVPHCGPTVGYRIDWDGVRVAYVSDHQAPEALDAVDRSVLELAEGVDVLIHDAQYTPDEFAAKSRWGHCTVGFAVEVARQAGVATLVLFHHDPAHGDDCLDELLGAARDQAGGDLEVVSAYEGMTLRVGASPTV